MSGGDFFFFLKTVSLQAVGSPPACPFSPSLFRSTFVVNAGIVGLLGTTALAQSYSVQNARGVGIKALAPPIGNIPLYSSYVQQALVRK